MAKSFTQNNGGAFNDDELLDESGSRSSSKRRVSDPAPSSPLASPVFGALAPKSAECKQNGKLSEPSDEEEICEPESEWEPDVTAFLDRQVTEEIWSSWDETPKSDSQQSWTIDAGRQSLEGRSPSGYFLANDYGLHSGQTKHAELAMPGMWSAPYPTDVVSPGSHYDYYYVNPVQYDANYMQAESKKKRSNNNNNNKVKKDSLIDIASRGKEAMSEHSAVKQGDTKFVPKFCASCGGDLQPSFKFCMFCGASVSLSEV